MILKEKAQQWVFFFLRIIYNSYNERRLDQHDFIYDPIVDIDIFGGVYGICR